MPFTGSHPAAVLPLMRWGLVPSALVIGSMAPDLPYYLPTPFPATTTHTPVGVVSADVLLGGLAFAVWQTVLAPFAIAIAPTRLRDRLDPRLPSGLAAHLRGWRQLSLLGLSLAIGAATHVVWDSFTHLGRWGTRNIDWLASTHAGLPGYRWAQYASGLIGGAAILVWFAQWWLTSTPHPRTDSRPAPVPRRIAYAVWIFIGLATVFGGLLGARPFPHDSGRYASAFLIATNGGSAGLVAALGCALCWLALPRRARRPTASASVTPVQTQQRPRTGRYGGVTPKGQCCFAMPTNARHASGPKASVPPSRSLVSRTSDAPGRLSATSTHDPPLSARAGRLPPPRAGQVVHVSAASLINSIDCRSGSAVAT